MTQTAVELLQDYDNPSLDRMIKFHALPTKQKAKGKMIEVLAPVIWEPRVIAQKLAELSEPARALIDLLVIAGGTASTGIIRRQLVRDGVIDARTEKKTSHSYGWSGGGSRGSIQDPSSRKFEDVTAWLGMAGLVFTSQPTHTSGRLVEIFKPGRVLFIPPQVLEHLPAVETPVETVASVEDSTSADSGTLLRDIYLLFSFSSREEMPLTNRGSINKRTLARINSTLTHQEDVSAVRGEEELAWLPLLRALGEEIGLLAQAAGQLVYEPRATEFLRLPAGERTLRLVEAYRRTSRWCELFRIPGIKVKGPGASLLESPEFVVAARQRVLLEITQLPVGEWVAVEHLVDRMRRSAYEFLFARRWSEHGYGWSDYSRYYEPSALPNPYEGHNRAELDFDRIESEEEGWDQVEAGFIRVIAAEALPAFGILDVGQIDEQRLAIRLTPEGKQLLNGETPHSPTPSAHVVVQPNFQVFVFEPATEDVLFTLDQFADRLRVDRAIEYELTRESFIRAQRNGFDTKSIIGHLQEMSTVELPQNVRRTIEEWGTQIERITVRTSSPVLQVIEAAQLDALYADRAITPLLGRRIAPTVAHIPARNVIPLSNLLVESGRLPALTEGPEDIPGKRIAVAQDGQIAFHHQLPSVYDVGLLRPFADEDTGRYRLTEGSLRRGAGAGLSADAILATLGRLNGEPLPSEVEALVHKWAKDWGRGALFEATVLQVDRPEALADLFTDPETREHLTPLPGSPTLALVTPEGAEALREMLEARGMTLGDRRTL